MNIFDFLEKGGLLMVPMAVCLVLGLLLFLERLYGLARSRVLPDDLVRTVLKLVNEGRFDHAETLCLKSGSAYSQIAHAAIKQGRAPRAHLKSVVDEKGALEVARLEKRIGVIGTLATIAPLLGLLGTVTGMIQVFQKIAEQADPQIDVLAGGIWEALVSTGAGLTIAIPFYVCYRYLLSLVDGLSIQLEESALDLIDAMSFHAGHRPDDTMVEEP